MRYIYLILFSALIMIGDLSAQKVQWASSVLEYSSHYMSSKYSAEQVLGPANVYPEGGDNKLAWSPKSMDEKEEFIKVGFDQPMKISQIVIYETHKPGAVKEVYAYDTNGDEFLIQKFSPKSTMRLLRKLELKFPMTPYEVSAVKVVLSPKKVEGYNQIDAIAISDSDEEVEVVVDVAEDIVFEGNPERLSENINTHNYAEQNPIISPDGSTMFFVRRNHPNNMGGKDDDNDIWMSVKDPAGKWGTAYNIGGPLNNSANNFVCSVTPDGNTLLLANVYKKDGTMGGGVSVTYRTKYGWAFPEQQHIENFYNNNRFVAYFLSNSKKVLLAACERNDSKGDLDIYVCFNSGDSKWTEPLNLGSVINTAGSEFAPFLASDERTLYFASDGHTGFGSADIFVTKRLDDSWTNWSKPKNIGDKINSEQWDAGYTITAQANYAYFNSTLEGSTDIYRIKLPKELKPDPVVLISGKVLDKKTGEPLDAIVYYEYLKNGMEAGVARSNPTTGEYKIILPYGYKYGFRAAADKYISINENLDLSSVKAYKEIEQDLELVPIEVGVVVRLNNIFFETGKSTLKEESYPELNRVVLLLKDNPSLKLELAGHTDNIGQDNTNLRLSKDRAEAVMNYLLSKLEGEGRLTAKGYGETTPVATNNTEKGRQLNRRVEFRILEF